MLRIRYPKIVEDKAQALARWANKEARTQRARDKLCQDKFGLSHRYLSRVGTIHKSPSNRTLEALGYEVVVRDKDTGAEEVVSLREDVA